MRIISTIALLLLTALATTSNAAKFGLAEIERAARANDIARLESIHAALASETPDYRHGYLGYVRAIALQTTGEDRAAKAALKDSVSILKDLVEQTPESAENWALLSAAYGLQTGFSPFKGPFLGPKANAAIDKALALAPENPRVRMIRGISLYHTPKMFGGDKREAIEWFSKAIESYGADAMPGWGSSQAYVWRAKAYYDFDEPALALADLDSALAIHPDYVWPQLLRERIAVE